MNKLSTILIIKNEEDKIEACLKSINWTDEIIIIDDESSDNTVSLAKKYTKNIYVRKLDNFASQKNYGISKAHFLWILNIDADEIITPGLKNEIKNIFKNQNLKDGYFIPFKNYLGKKWLKHGGLYPDYHLRLFKKDKARFEKSVHEEINLKNVGYLKNTIIHSTYDDYKDFWKKVKKYSRIEARLYTNKPSFLSYFKPIKFFLGIYLKKQGFRDGFAGFINALFLSLYDLRVYYYTRRNNQ